MADNKVIDSKVLQELVNKLQDIVNNYCWNFEEYTSDEVEQLFDGTSEDISYYSSLIKDDQVSKNFLHSSKQIADDIAKAILEANEYTDSLLKNISSIKLEYVTELPTSDISESTIYILKSTDGTSNDTLNLYNTTNGWTEIGDFTIDLTNYIDRTTYDTDMALKANKNEVVSNDKIVQTLDSATNSSDTILSTNGLQTELNKKVDKSNYFITEKTTLGGQTDIRCWDDIVDGHNNNYCALSYYLPNGDIKRIQQDNGSDNIWYCTLDHNTSTWSTKKICNTSVTDIEKTTLAIGSTTAFSEGAITYNVTNGICDLTLAGITNTTCSAFQLSTTSSLPIPKNGLVTIPIVNDTNGEIVGMFYIDANYNSLPTCHIYKTNSRGFCTISYAVSE